MSMLARMGRCKMYLAVQHDHVLGLQQDLAVPSLGLAAQLSRYTSVQLPHPLTCGGTASDAHLKLLEATIQFSIGRIYSLLNITLM